MITIDKENGVGRLELSIKDVRKAVSNSSLEYNLTDEDCLSIIERVLNSMSGDDQAAVNILGVKGMINFYVVAESLKRKTKPSLTTIVERTEEYLNKHRGE